MTFWPGRTRSGVIPDRRRVLAQRRNVVRTRLHALVLHAQDVDDVGVADRVDVGRLLDRKLARQQCRRTDERAPWHSHECERLHERASDARVQDVPDDRDVQAIEPAELLRQRIVEVEQRLGRVLVHAVAGIHHVRLGCGGDQPRRADLRVADHDHVRVVSPKRDRECSFSDSPLSTDEPTDFTVSVSADSRCAASSKLEEVRVDDS